MNISEDQLCRWAASPSESERQRMENAEGTVRRAIAASEKLRARTIRVFAQGSYRNRVNVRQDSDVDVAVVCTDEFFWHGPDGPAFNIDSLGYPDGAYIYDDFRREVGEALRAYFPSGSITDGDKAFDVKANTYRVDADVAPFFEHRRFASDGSYITGVEMRPRSGGRIINWPDQHYDNAVAKNTDTERAFKGCVRILKTLRYRMIEDKVRSAEQAASFLCECLIWNVPNDLFGHSSWGECIRACLAHLFNNTRLDQDSSEWGEVSELKYLFRGPQPWTYQSAHSFISDCWDYLGLE